MRQIGTLDLLEYDGIFKDPAIERRKILLAYKEDQKFKPYKPMDYEKQFGKLRDFSKPKPSKEYKEEIKEKS